MIKKAKELAIHEKDTGSSEVQIALLTEKIEVLSKHVKEFKKRFPQTHLHSISALLDDGLSELKKRLLEKLS